MGDKELLIKAVGTMAAKVAKDFYGIGPVLSRFMIDNGIKNVLRQYDFVINMFFDENGNIDSEGLFNAMKSEVNDRGGIVLGKIRFTAKDIEELQQTFNNMKNGTVNS